MGVLFGFIFILVGTIFFASGGGWAILYALITDRFAMDLFMPEIVFAAIGFAILLFGVYLMASGLIRSRKKKTRTLRILERGVSAEGIITFVGPDPRSRVGAKAAGFVVEFKFHDQSGVERTGRDDSIDPKLAASLGLHPGGKIQLKYLEASPEQGILLLD